MSTKGRYFAQALGEFGQSIQQMGETIYKVDADNEATTLQLDIASQIEKFTQDLATDPDPGTPGVSTPEGYMQKWDKFSQELRNKADSARNPLARQEVNNYLGKVLPGQGSKIAQLQYSTWAEKQYGTTMENVVRLQANIGKDGFTAQHWVTFAGMEFGKLRDMNMMTPKQYLDTMNSLAQPMLENDLYGQATKIYDEEGEAAAARFIADASGVYVAPDGQAYTYGDSTRSSASKRLSTYAAVAQQKGIEELQNARINTIEFNRDPDQAKRRDPNKQYLDIDLIRKSKAPAHIKDAEIAHFLAIEQDQMNATWNAADTVLSISYNDGSISRPLLNDVVNGTNVSGKNPGLAKINQNRIVFWTSFVDDYEKRAKETSQQAVYAEARKSSGVGLNNLYRLAVGDKTLTESDRIITLDEIEALPLPDDEKGPLRTTFSRYEQLRVENNRARSSVAWDSRLQDSFSALASSIDAGDSTPSAIESARKEAADLLAEAKGARDRGEMDHVAYSRREAEYQKIITATTPIERSFVKALAAHSKYMTSGEIDPGALTVAMVEAQMSKLDPATAKSWMAIARSANDERNAKDQEAELDRLMAEARDRSMNTRKWAAGEDYDDTKLLTEQFIKSLEGKGFSEGYLSGLSGDIATFTKMRYQSDDNAEHAWVAKAMMNARALKQDPKAPIGKSERIMLPSDLLKLQFHSYAEMEVLRKDLHEIYGSTSAGASIKKDLKDMVLDSYEAASIAIRGIMKNGGTYVWHIPNADGTSFTKVYLDKTNALQAWEAQTIGIDANGSSRAAMLASLGISADIAKFTDAFTNQKIMSVVDNFQTTAYKVIDADTYKYKNLSSQLKEWVNSQEPKTAAEADELLKLLDKKGWEGITTKNMAIVYRQVDGVDEMIDFIADGKAAGYVGRETDVQIGGRNVSMLAYKHPAMKDNAERYAARLSDELNKTAKNLGGKLPKFGSDGQAWIRLESDEEIIAAGFGTPYGNGDRAAFSRRKDIGSIDVTLAKVDGDAYLVRYVYQQSKDAKSGKLVEGQPVTQAYVDGKWWDVIRPANSTKKYQFTFPPVVKKDPSFSVPSSMVDVPPAPFTSGPLSGRK